MHGRLDVPAGDEAQGVAGVDGDAPVERLSPLPLARLVLPDLQPGDGLAEEQRHGAQVRVPAGPEAVAKLGDLVLGEARVLHVAQVGVVVGLPLVQVDEEVLGQLERDGGQVEERVQHLVVQLLGEVEDRLLVVLEELGEGLDDAAVVGCSPRQLPLAVQTKASRIRKTIGRGIRYVLAMLRTSILSLTPPLRRWRPAGP